MKPIFQHTILLCPKNVYLFRGDIYQFGKAKISCGKRFWGVRPNGKYHL